MLRFFETREQYVTRICEGDFPACHAIMWPGFWEFYGWKVWAVAWVLLALWAVSEFLAERRRR